jgi:hypothetical protein
MLTGLAVFHCLALYFEWHLPALSSEAKQYQELVWRSGSGFSLFYALQKLCWFLGTVVGVLGAACMLLRRKIGLILFAVCLPILYAATLFGAPPSAYPNIVTTAEFLFWCASSALWGCIFVYALLQRRALFGGGGVANPVSNVDSVEYRD